MLWYTFNKVRNFSSVSKFSSVNIFHEFMLINLTNNLHSNQWTENVDNKYSPIWIWIENLNFIGNVRSDFISMQASKQTISNPSFTQMLAWKVIIFFFDNYGFILFLRESFFFYFLLFFNGKFPCGGFLRVFAN